MNLHNRDLDSVGFLLVLINCLGVSRNGLVSIGPSQNYSDVKTDGLSEDIDALSNKFLMHVSESFIRLRRFYKNAPKKDSNFIQLKESCVIIDKDSPGIIKEFLFLT